MLKEMHPCFTFGTKQASCIRTSLRVWHNNNNAPSISSWFLYGWKTWWAKSVKQVLSCRCSLVLRVFLMEGSVLDRFVEHVTFCTDGSFSNIFLLFLQSFWAPQRNWTSTTRTQTGEYYVWQYKKLVKWDAISLIWALNVWSTCLKVAPFSVHGPLIASTVSS